MAPTLRGAHLLKRGPETGYQFAVGPVDTNTEHVAYPWQKGPYEFGDPMLAWGETERDRDEANRDRRWDDRRGWRGWRRPRPPAPPKPGEHNTPVRVDNEPIRLGDRILVLKYIYLLREPERFDVVVFKNPTNPEENFIKRLLGLPGEVMWLLDGDVFTRPLAASDDSVVDDDDLTPRFDAGWATNGDLQRMKIQRKPLDVQRTIWVPVFDSDFIPGNGSPSEVAHNTNHVAAPADRPGSGRDAHLVRTGTQSAGSRPPELLNGQAHTNGDDVDVSDVPGGNSDVPEFMPPFTAEPAQDWALANRRSYRLFSDAAASLRFDEDLCPIDDRLVYNVTMRKPAERVRFNVSDIRVRLGVRPDEDELQTAVQLEAHGHVFEAAIEPNGVVTLRFRPENVNAWTELAREQSSHFRLPADRTTMVEFWHYDQSLWLWIDGRLAAQATYEWSAADRLTYVYGWTPEELAREPDHALFQGRREPSEPELSLHFEGSPLTLYRVRVDRDLYFRPQLENDYGPPARGTHPMNLARLDADQFFMSGDNSSASHDSRRLDDAVPWVQHKFGVSAGIVPRKLLLGKAFFVYFPSPEPLRPGGARLIPNFGEMRFIH